MMKKYLLILTLMIFGLSVGYAQEEELWRQEQDSRISSASYNQNEIALLQEEQQEGQNQGQNQEEGPNQEGEMGEEKLPMQPLPLQDSEARENSTRTDLPVNPFLLQDPEGSINNEAPKPAVPVVVDKKEEESVLSYNFLYLLIQKFKLSDIMED